jgi:cyclohexanone monooxygenase
MPGVNSQSAVVVNLSDVIQENGAHVAHIIGELIRRNALTFEVSADAEAEWVRTIVEGAPDNAAFLAACTPGRYNNEGRITERPKQNANYSGGALRLYEILKGWRETGELAGLEVTSQ